MADLCVGDTVTIPSASLCRSGETGSVIETFDDGVSLDFFRCFCGATRCACYTSIEYWSFAELRALGAIEGNADGK